MNVSNKILSCKSIYNKLQSLNNYSKYAENILGTIGNTISELNRVIEGVDALVLAKVETLIGNSVKDRMA
jgi:hypothetical protein